MAEKGKKAEKEKTKAKVEKKKAEKVGKKPAEKKAKKEVKRVEKKAVEEAKVEKKEEKKEKAVGPEKQLKAYEVLKFPLITEKAVNMIESENKLVFIVNQNATKADVRRAVESLYGVEVDGVNIIRDMKSRKRAIVKINKKYIDLDEKQRGDLIKGQIVDLINDCGRTTVLAEIFFENGLKEYTIAAEGIAIGQAIEYGKKAVLNIGNAAPLAGLAEGCPIFNIEKTPGDGGAFIRSSGSYGVIITKDKKNVYVKLPSGKTIPLNPNCRATIGCVAGGGRKEKPFVKAGAKFWAKKARGKYYPIVRGVAMNPVSHPHGGSQHHVGHSKSVSRHAPPGAKVGAIASSRTGRRKKN